MPGIRIGLATIRSGHFKFDGSRLLLSTPPLIWDELIRVRCDWERIAMNTILLAGLTEVVSCLTNR